MAKYATTDQIRAYTRISSNDMSDADIQELIDRATARIESITGRTWQGLQFVNEEYYDGNGEVVLWLNHPDLYEIDSISISEDNGSTYTEVSVAYVKVYSGGYIKLTADAQVSKFNQGEKHVKVSYLHGNSSIPDDVTDLCIKMVAQMLHLDDNRVGEIKEDFERLKWTGAQPIYTVE